MTIDSCMSLGVNTFRFKPKNRTKILGSNLKILNQFLPKTGIKVFFFLITQYPYHMKNNG